MRDPVRVARLRIYDMLDNIEYARSATRELSLQEYLDRRVIQLATERAIGIISEASRHIPDDLKAAAPEVPWPKIAGIGNVLRHEYREVAPRAIWTIIEAEFGQLEAALRRMLARIGET